jgi:CheY-like chemotaxis protein
VRVPRVAQERRPERHRPPAAPPDTAGLHALKVLVVDNDLTILDAMQALLEQWGVRVFKAQAPREALQLVSSQAVDAVLADYHLGDGMNGLELLERVSELAGASIARALITADHAAELTRAARRVAVPLLHKPLRPAALRALLSAFKLRLTRSSAA